MSKKKVPILRCTSISFVKKPKRDMKSAMLSITYETASGTWTSKKVFEDVWKFVESTGKSHKKFVGKLMVNASKYKDEYLKKSKPDGAFKLIEDVINTVGKNKKILQNDSKITAFVGAKRTNLSDIKSGQKIGKSKSSKSTKAPSSMGSAAFAGDKASKSKKHKASKEAAAAAEEDKEDDNDKENDEPAAAVNAHAAAQSHSMNEHDMYKRQVMDLKQEIEDLKRTHLKDISALKQENHNLINENQTLKETNAASQEARQELEEKVIKYEHELGKDQIGDDMAAIFADEFQKEDDPAEKYFQQTREQQKRIAQLEEQVQKLTRENGELTTKLGRAKYIADHLATEVTELSDPKYEQLEQDYKEVELELDEITKIKEEYEDQMAQTAVVLDGLELEAAKLRPVAEEYPNLMKKIEDQRKELAQMQEKLSTLQEERDDFEDKFLAIKKCDVVPMDQYKSTVKSYKAQIKEIQEAQGAIEEEKAAAIGEMQDVKSQMAEIKIKLGELTADNERLEAGGGRDINLDILMDLESDFSLFKADEFEYPPNASRDQLVLWCEHLKLLMRETAEVLCGEINRISGRNETLENYIEAKGLPFPEDCEFNQSKVNELPHPLPSMKFMADLDGYNPSKKQLKDYIDLMFAEWARDEDDSNRMFAARDEDLQLLAYLEGGGEEEEGGGEEKEERESGETKKLKKQLEAAYLREEEMKLEHNKELGELKNSNETLTKQLRAEQQKQKAAKEENMDQPKAGALGAAFESQSHSDTDSVSHTSDSLPVMVDDDEIVLLRNRLVDTEQYAKDLEDDMKQLEFISAQQKQAMEREHKYAMETIHIDLEESRTQCEDLERQIGSDNLNLVASEFRTELWDARNDNNELKKKHIEEIRQLERDGDELLREINLLRIKTDRMDQNTDEAVAKIQIELDKKEKELQHSMQVASNLSQVKETMDTLSADKEELERSYQHLLHTREGEKQSYVSDIQQLAIEKKKLIIRIQTAEEDIKQLKSGQGIDSEAIITRTELVKMKEEMDNLRQKRAEAVKSKIRLLQNSSLEIERMRDQIRSLFGGFAPSAVPRHRGMSTSSLGSAVPGGTHQHMLDDESGYVGSAWNYTVGMLSSVGTAMFGAEKKKKKRRQSSRYQQQQQQQHQHILDDDYDIHSEYNMQSHSPQQQSYGQPHPHRDPRAHVERHTMDRSMSYRQPDHTYSSSSYQQQHRQDAPITGHQKKPSRHMSTNRRQLSRYKTTPHQMQQIQRESEAIQMHSMGAAQHSRGLSAAAVRAKRNRNKRMQQKRGTPHEKTFSNMSSARHRQKQPSKQEILLEQTENETIRDAMAGIFDAFEIAQDNVNKQSMDMTAAAQQNKDNMAMFSLDDMVQNDMQQDTRYVNDDFWNNNEDMQPTDRLQNVNHLEYSDDRFGMAQMDFSGDAALHGL